ncbi:ATP-binding cassette domain-containing protein [Dinghuibacter silviterrae]|uniref:ABC-2 type transport system ATP-binding protein n=1 Tax=Dinghuibacter silviterrae TaxID=1539049 RepID=A0A4R8DPA9_9BACT|nr:ATP-binding cassette domain-containing protein [Dinghuibacter silviterrae]TDW99537.1 ABC-2 type transport system ATP-binding protein [Dinghuibacter silviterrae]
MSISVQHLTKRYGEQTAVNDLSFSVGQGEIVGFLGPNGAGKSTTMKIITGYLDADEGSVEVMGRRVRDNPLETKKVIGYLPEANPLYYDMYVKEYLHFIADVHHLGKDTRGRIDEAITLTGLTPEYKKTIGTLSKGYKQRVGLAAALLHHPGVLILDEPTSGLDPNQIIEIRELIRNLGKNKTVLFSSHILQEVEALCDRVIIINKGNLVADARLAELRSAGSGKDEVTLVIKESVPASVFEAEPLIEQCRMKGEGHWTLTTVSSTELKKRLLELSLQNNWNIVSLHSESGSLEAIFRSLTSN